MPKLGYTTLIVKKSIRNKLEKLAREEGFRTVNQLLGMLLRFHPHTARVQPRAVPN